MGNPSIAAIKANYYYELFRGFDKVKVKVEAKASCSADPIEEEWW